MVETFSIFLFLRRVQYFLFQFAKLCPPDKISLLKQKSSLFMATGCCLEVAKEEKNAEEKVTVNDYGLVFLLRWKLLTSWRLKARWMTHMLTQTTTA